jgi:Arc/MetJ-type ribon-helix-helix transcriptional regulator
MAKQETRVHKKLGRPPGRLYRETIPVRLTEEAVAAIDAWIERQAGAISRSEAIRRLVDRGLASEGKAGKTRGTK